MTTIPGPAAKPIIGALDALDNDAPVQGMMRLAEEYGELYQIPIPGTRPLLVASSQRLIDELCDESRFDKKVHGALKNIRSFAGDGLFTARTQEENWGKAHRILMPAFGPPALRSMFDGMIDIAEQLMLKWERMGPQADLDVVHDFTRLTLDTIALCSFSYRFNSFYKEDMDPFIDSMVDALDESGRRGRRLPIQTRLMFLTQRRFDEDVRVMHEVADRVIAERKKRPLPNGEHDILDTMLTATDPETGERLSDENVRYQLVTFLIAGHETTSGLLSFTMYELLRNPDVLAKAQAHVDEVLGDEYPRFEHLTKLGYLDQILKESLRLWPTAPAMGFYPYEETTIGGEFKVGRGQTVMAVTPTLHRDPTVWPDPERFDPDRFTFEAQQDLPPNAWKPFGNGQRSCIGRGFALQEAQLVLAMLLQRFDLQWADPAYQLTVKETLTLKPEGLFIRAIPRGKRPVAGAATDEAAVPKAGVQQTADAHGTPIQVLYGSNAGTSEDFANQVANRASALGFAPTVSSLDDAVGALSTDGPVVIVSASYEGQPPDNARKFTAWLAEQQPGSLGEVSYAVFGCGNKDWARTYQAIPTQIDEQLAAAGAKSLTPRGAADARGDFFGDFEDWHEQLWAAVLPSVGVEGVADAPASNELDVQIVEGGRDEMLRAAGLDHGTIVVNRELVNMAAANARSKRHLEIVLPEGQRYQTGDYLAVLPLNPVEVVDRALTRMSLHYDTRLKISAAPGQSTQLPVDAPVSAGELFASYLELSRPAGRRQVEQLAEAASDPAEADALRALAEDEAYEREVLGKRLSVLDLLEAHRSVELPVSSFIAMLTPLSPRQYSISSSPHWSGDHVTLTVAHLDAPALSGRGRHQGAASTFLAQARPGTRVPVTIRPSNVAFHPPTELSTPMVMVCAGTGLAPFRGFIQDRALRAQAADVTPAPALLFFGCDAPDVDLLYADELAAWEADGIVSVRTAFSEAPEDGPDGPIRFVQDRLWADRAEVGELVRQGANFYVCGDGKFMAPAVHDTCVRMYAEATGSSAADSEEWMNEMERVRGRYVSDVFA